MVSSPWYTKLLFGYCVLCAAMVLASCVEKISIELTQSFEKDELPPDRQLVASQQVADPYSESISDYANGYSVLEFSSGRDLRRLVVEKSYSHLYFIVKDCESDPDGAEDLYRGIVFSSDQLSESRPSAYFVALPKDIELAFSRWAKAQGRETPALPTDVCLRMGAGNMSGESLTTNWVRMNLDKNL